VWNEGERLEARSTRAWDPIICEAQYDGILSAGTLEWCERAYNFYWIYPACEQRLFERDFVLNNPENTLNGVCTPTAAGGVVMGSDLLPLGEPLHATPAQSFEGAMIYDPPYIPESGQIHEYWYRQMPGRLRFSVEVKDQVTRTTFEIPGMDESLVDPDAGVWTVWDQGYGKVYLLDFVWGDEVRWEDNGPWVRSFHGEVYLKSLSVSVAPMTPRFSVVQAGDGAEVITAHVGTNEFSTLCNDGLDLLLE